MNLGHTLRDTYSRVRRGADRPRIELDEDALYDLLADSRRRFVVESLDDRDAETCADLALDIAASETHMPKEQVPRRRVESVKEDLRDEQLPRLADAWVVRWDEGDDVVRPGHSFEGIASLLRDIDRRVKHVSGSGGSASAVDISATNWGTQRSHSNGGRYHP